MDLAYAPEALTIQTVIIAIVFGTLIALVTSSVLALFELDWGAVHERPTDYRMLLARSLGQYWKLVKKLVPFLMAHSIPISVVGYIAGMMTAFSRSAAVGNVLPAVLAMIAGLNIYIFGSDSKNKVLVAYCVSLFAVMLFYGSSLGAFNRDAEREARLTELARQELNIRGLRKNLDLPDDFPNWMISTEPK
jgi:hypothetical protein